MNIKARINARKIVLSYLYQHCFFVNLMHQDAMITESLFIDYTFKTDAGKYDKEKEKLIKQIRTHVINPTPETFKEFIDGFFNERAMEDIDFDYISQVGGQFTKYIEMIQKHVDAYTQTFGYVQMDLLDQVIFLLGYTEWKVLETPKEVLLNEMIELAKRYSDE